MHSKLTKFLCLQLQFIPDLSRFSSTNRQQTELLKKSNAASISGSFRHVVLYMKFHFAGRNHAFSSHSFTEVARVRVTAGRRIRAARAKTGGDAYPLTLMVAKPITSASASGDSAGGTARKVRSIFLLHPCK